MVDVLVGVGDGTFATPVSYDAGFGASLVRLADLDADNDLDMVVVRRIVSVPPTDATITVLLANGDATFQPPVHYTVGQRSQSCAVADLNADGAPDVVVTNIDTNELSLLLGNGDGSLQPQTRLPYADEPTDIATADLLGDGFPDLVFLHNATSDLSVVLNQCDSPACNPADIAEPFGALDFSDVIAFLSAFGSMDPAADLAEPTGAFDFSDVVAFLSAFGAGCP